MHQFICVIVCRELFTIRHVLPCSTPQLPPQEALGPYAHRPTNETQTVVEFMAVRAGKSFLSFNYVGNDSNETVFKK